MTLKIMRLVFGEFHRQLVKAKPWAIFISLAIHGVTKPIIGNVKKY
jgi:hypothetical protein